MPDEKAPSSGAFLPLSLMYFLSGELMHYLSGVDKKAGIWAGRFIEPSRWRRGDRLQASKGRAADACQIKGNISRSGERIYHVPGARDYGPTRIDESKGERWFCSEDEALKAGWRRSGQ